MFDKEILRKKIIEVREKKGLNKAQLAASAGITPAAITQIEKGDRTPTLPVLHRIASVLEVSADYLLGNTEKPELEDLLQNEEVMTFYRGFQTLDSSDRETIINNIEFLRSQKREKKK